MPTFGPYGTSDSQNCFCDSIYFFFMLVQLNMRIKECFGSCLPSIYWSWSTVLHRSVCPGVQQQQRNIHWKAGFRGPLCLICWSRRLKVLPAYLGQSWSMDTSYNRCLRYYCDDENFSLAVVLLVNRRISELENVFLCKYRPLLDKQNNTIKLKIVVL